MKVEEWVEGTMYLVSEGKPIDGSGKSIRYRLDTGLDEWLVKWDRDLHWAGKDYGWVDSLVVTDASGEVLVTLTIQGTPQPGEPIEFRRGTK